MGGIKKKHPVVLHYLCSGEDIIQRDQANGLDRDSFAFVQDRSKLTIRPR